VAFVLPLSIVFVEPGHGGVLWKRFAGGTTFGPAYGEGYHIVPPWDRLTVYDLRLQVWEASLQALTSDGLDITVEVVLRYRLSPNNLAYLHSSVGPDYVAKLIRPQVEAVVHELIALYPIEQVLGPLRTQIQRATLVALTDRTRLNSMGLIDPLTGTDRLELGPPPFASSALTRGPGPGGPGPVAFPPAASAPAPFANGPMVIVPAPAGTSPLAVVPGPVAIGAAGIVPGPVFPEFVTVEPALLSPGSLTQAATHGEVNTSVNSLNRPLLLLQDTLISRIVMPVRVRAAIEAKLEQNQRAQEYEYRLVTERAESERKVIEADGIRRFQQAVAESLTPGYLTLRGIEASEALARSNNAKVIVIGGSNGLPLILNTGEAAAMTGPVAAAPSATAPSPAAREMAARASGAPALEP
jgi:regulator of protease activity HflC (stomatin/prohibitin superfamily)